MAIQGRRLGTVGGVIAFALVGAHAMGQSGCSNDGTVLPPANPDASADGAKDGAGDAAEASASCERDAGSGAIGTVGCKCTTPGALACNGNAQKLPIVCLGGVWTAGTPCAIDHNCVTTLGPNAGICAPIDTACAGAMPGQQVCGSINTIVTCGPDLVYQTAVHTCTGNTPTCSGGKCTCPGTTCGMSCVDVKTDPNNCGGCGKVCDGGGCSDGKCSSPSSIDSSAGTPSAITVDSANVYFLDATGGNVVKVPIAGGAPVTLATGQTASPAGIAIDATNVYWTNKGTNTCSSGDAGTCTYNQDGTVVQVPIAGGTPVTLATGQDFPVGITVMQSIVYWVNTNGGTVMSTPAGGGPVVTLAAGQPSPWAIASSTLTQSIYWLDRGTVQNEHHDGALVRMTPEPAAEPDAGPINLMAANLLDPTALAVDTATIYWTSQGTEAAGYKDGAVLKLPITGGNPTFVALGQGGPSSVVVDSKNVYWTNAASGTVVSVPIKGGIETVLAIGQSLPSAMPDSIAARPPNVYWVNQGAGSVMSVAAP